MELFMNMAQKKKKLGWKLNKEQKKRCEIIPASAQIKTFTPKV